MAWFVDTPQHAAGGQVAADALARLLLLFGHEEFKVADTSLFEDPTRTDRVEVVIPLRRRFRVPRPSVN